MRPSSGPAGGGFSLKAWWLGGLLYPYYLGCLGKEKEDMEEGVSLKERRRTTAQFPNKHI